MERRCEKEDDCEMTTGKSSYKAELFVSLFAFPGYVGKEMKEQKREKKRSNQLGQSKKSERLCSYLDESNQDRYLYDHFTATFDVPVHRRDGRISGTPYIY